MRLWQVLLEKNRVGFTIQNLKEISERLSQISEEEYRELVMNTENIGKKLRNGYYFKNALNRNYESRRIMKNISSKKIAKNYIYNSLYQVLILITPLITTPYVSRVLGVTGIGVYNYTDP